MKIVPRVAGNLPERRLHLVLSSESPGSELVTVNVDPPVGAESVSERGRGSTVLARVCANAIANDSSVSWSWRGMARADSGTSRVPIISNDGASLVGSDGSGTVLTLLCANAIANDSPVA